MGSFIGQTLIGEHGEAYAGVVLAGSNGPPRPLGHTVRALARTQLVVLAGRAPGRWVHRVVMGIYNKPFAPNRTPVDWLSRDDAKVDRHVADPLCGFMFTAQAWFDFLDGKRILGDDGHLRRIALHVGEEAGLDALQVLAVGFLRVEEGERDAGGAVQRHPGFGLCRAPAGPQAEAGR